MSYDHHSQNPFIQKAHTSFASVKCQHQSWVFSTSRYILTRRHVFMLFTRMDIFHHDPQSLAWVDIHRFLTAIKHPVALDFLNIKRKEMALPEKNSGQPKLNRQTWPSSLCFSLWITQSLTWQYAYFLLSLTFMRYFVYCAVRKQISAYTKDTAHISWLHQHILNSLPKLNSND